MTEKKDALSPQLRALKTTDLSPLDRIERGIVGES
jgi:hypothetical protein